MNKIEANIVLARCPENNKKLYAIRMQKNGSNWNLTWAFPVDEKKAKSEGYDRTDLKGTFIPAENYNGCPTCKAKAFMYCPRCSKITCYHGESRATCAWCGLSGETKVQDDLVLKGGKM